MLINYFKYDKPSDKQSDKSTSACVYCATYPIMTQLLTKVTEDTQQLLHSGKGTSHLIYTAHSLLCCCLFKSLSNLPDSLPNPSVKSQCNLDMRPASYSYPEVDLMLTPVTYYKI